MERPSKTRGSAPSSRGRKGRSARQRASAGAEGQKRSEITSSFTSGPQLPGARGLLREGLKSLHLVPPARETLAAPAAGRGQAGGIRARRERQRTPGPHSLPAPRSGRPRSRRPKQGAGETGAPHSQSPAPLLRETGRAEVGASGNVKFSGKNRLGKESGNQNSGFNSVENETFTEKMGVGVIQWE